jgi:hypothetical protein
MLEKKPGPCRMRTNNTRYYYDKTMKKCLPFEVKYLLLTNPTSLIYFKI